MADVLIVDDEPNIVFSVTECLGSPTLHVSSASTGKRAVEMIKGKSFDAVVLDVRLPDMHGLEVFDRIREVDPRLPVIMMTAYARTETAIEAMRRGAFEYLLKPVDFHQLRDVVGRALEASRLGHVPAILEDEEDQESSSAPADRIIGRSRSMQEVYKAVGRVAPQNVPILILGESGTGKELIARALYHYGPRSQAPFMAINCAALPENLLESELFGHERGAFTGADQRRIGKFEQVNGGTIFLDEIGDMSLPLQAKALRLLQEQQFERVGGNQTIETDVRVIAATNKDLNAMVREGKFRLDLLYRLNGFTIQLPPLRERMEDIPVLVDHFVKKFNRDLGKNVHSVPEPTMRLLVAHDWPGNIRELQSVVNYAMVQCAGESIQPSHLPESFQSSSTMNVASFAAPAGSPDGEIQTLVRHLLAKEQEGIYNQASEAFDRLVLGEVLRHVHGNQREAARLLGMSRVTLRSKLRALGISTGKPPGNDDSTVG